MMMKISKIGMILSLAMVIHALFYPNRFSLIIAIVGYIIALASAVAYGLCKPNRSVEKVLQENLVEEQIPDFKLEKTINTIPKMSFYVPRTIHGFPTISASKLSNNYNDIIDKIVLENPNLNSNDLETIREIKDIGLDEGKRINQIKNYIPGYQ